MDIVSAFTSVANEVACWGGVTYWGSAILAGGAVGLLLGLTGKAISRVYSRNFGGPEFVPLPTRLRQARANNPQIQNKLPTCSKE